MPDGWRQADKPEALPGATETRVSAPGKKADPRGKPEGNFIRCDEKEGRMGRGLRMQASRNWIP